VFGEADAAFAEYVCAPQDRVEHRPPNISAEQASALPLAANTALIAVRDAARVRSGHRVLINGAAGGVGLFAVQLAHSYGAVVTAVCSGRNIELVRSSGATDIVDYARDDFTVTDRPYDVLIDLVGNRSLHALRRAVTTKGTLVLSGGGVFRGGSLVGPMALIIRASVVARFARQRIVLPNAAPSAENLATIRDLAASGVLHPVIDRRLPLDEAAAAIAYLETGHARAKTVLIV